MNAYTKTFQEFRGDPSKMNDAWNETAEQLLRIDPTETRSQVEGHAYVSILESILFAAGSVNKGQTT